MRNIYKGILFTFAALLTVVTGCDDTLDINTSPNNPATSTPAFTLPTAQASAAYAINLDLGILSGFQAQYWTQAPQAGQYQVFDQYTYNGNSTSTAWLHLYAWALEDFKFVREQGLEDGTPNYAAIADILTAYSVQVATDFWGDVPYSEALQGKDGNLTPIYDDQQVVYDSLIAIVDRGIANIDASNAAIVPGTDDLIFNGDMRLWLKFANTLKLRIFLRQADARPTVAQQGIQALYASGAEFLEGDEDGFVSYSGAANNENPYYSGDISQLNIGLSGVNTIASNSVLSRLETVADPRVDAFYNLATSGADNGFHEGLDQGVGADQGSVSRPVTDFSTPGSLLSGPSSGVYFITGFESLFLQAEAVARGWGTGSAQELYEEAVQASFNFTNAGSAATFIGPGGVYEYGATAISGVANSGIADIQYQKWIAMNGSQNAEAWSEFRRTFIPRDMPLSFVGASLPGSMLPGGRTFPQKALYPTSEVSNNPNTAPVGNIEDPIWWSFEALN